jgi:CubicO group peptidase (beta-lactamase class C family)
VRPGPAWLVFAAACGPAISQPHDQVAPVQCATPCQWTRLAIAVDSGVSHGAAPGAVVAISLGGVRYLHGTGRLGVDDSTMPGSNTVYDLASLTKVIGLTTMVMFAVADGRIDLSAPVGTYVPAFTGPGKDGVTIRHLLTHSSGLPAHRRLWEQSAGRPEALALVNATPLDTLPGARTVYSDLGAIVLTEALESVAGSRIDSILARSLFGPLDMTSTRYLPPASWQSRIAPTEQDPWRGRMLKGEVHDENAGWLGGVSGHAGLFSTAEDLLVFGEWLLDQWHGPHTAGPGPRLPSAVVREFTRRQDLVPGASRALGWDTPSAGSSAGIRLSARSFGHTGFTGTSIWIDPDRDLVVVLLSNRVHPTRDNPRLGPLRAVAADRAVAVIEGRP